MKIEIVDNPVVISWSEIDAYRQCPFKHMLAYRERWQETTLSPALQKGTLWHTVMEIHYKQLKKIGKRPRTAKAMQPAIDQINTLLGVRNHDQTEIQQLVLWMYEGYIDAYGLDEEWEILHVEDKMFAPLPNPRGGPSRFMLKVKMDLIVRWRGRVWQIDHKTGQNLPSEKELDLLDQFGLYTWCLRENGIPVMGSIFNAARTQRNKGPMELDKRFSRTILDYTPTQLDTIAAEAYMTAEKMWPEQFDSLLPERTPNEDTCRWRCPYTEACLHSRKGNKIEPMLKAYGITQSVFREVEKEWAEWKSRS
jgi:RecB family exonuclease